MMGLARWERALVALALVKVALGVGAYLFAVLIDAGGLSPRTHLMAAHVLVYGTAAVILLSAGARDPRAVLWGVISLLAAEAFTDPTVDLVRLSAGGRADWLWRVNMLQANAFSPYFIWRFAHEFPKVSSFGLRAFTHRVMITTAAVFGGVFIVLNVLAYASIPAAMLPGLDRGDVPGGALWAVMRANSSGPYWPLFYAIALPACIALFAKLPAARREERRRAWLLVTGYAIGALPSALWILATSFSSTIAEVLPLRIAGWVIYPSLLFPPFLTGYAVVVHQALDVRLVARNALRYAMTRYTLTGLAIIPIVALLASVFRSRNRSLVDILGDGQAPLLLVLAMAGFVGLRFRRSLLNHVDRLFFPDVYRAREIVRGLVDESRRATNPSQLTTTLSAGLAEAFRPETVHVLLASMGTFDTSEGTHRPLAADSPILDSLESTSGALHVDLSKGGTRIRALPEEDRFWLADGGVRLLVAIRAPGAPVLGLVALGEKDNDLPYTREDVELLESVASATAVALGFMHLHGSAPVGPDEIVPVEDAKSPGAECPSCGRVEATSEIRCSSCGVELEAAPVPLVLANKFRIAEKLGAGGMGVVYRALDLSLGRSVAIKTLPRTTPGHSARLRREARAMASVSHPNLALIFGGESWRGVPMLVFEYLPGGTLADRLEEGPLLTHEVISIGVALSAAVQAIHKAGILHRDIKPSNIGFTLDGTPKLLDFGLARILGGARTRSGGNVADVHGAPFPGAMHDDDGQADQTLTREQDVLGTPLYLSPEAVDGGAPDPLVDLWALALTLYEAASGVNPVEERTLGLTLLHIVQQGVPDLRDVVPSADPELAAFFSTALARDPRDRPRSAAELGSALAALQLRAAA